MKFFKKIVSVLMVFLFVITSVFLTISLVMKWNLQEEKLSATLKDADISFLLHSFGEEGQRLIEDTRGMLETIGIPSDTTLDVLNSDATKDFLSKYLIEILNYFLYQTPVPEVTAEDIRDLVIENYEVVEQSLEAKGLTFTEAQKEFIENNLEKYSKVIMDFFPTMNLLTQKILENVTFYQGFSLQDMMGFLGWLTSWKTIFVLGICDLVFLVVLFFCNLQQRKFWDFLQKAMYGYVFLFIAIEILLSTVVKEYIMKEVLSAQEFTNYMVNALCKDLWIFIFIGIVVLFFCGHFKKGRKKYASILDELYPRSGEEIKKESRKK